MALIITKKIIPPVAARPGQRVAAQAAKPPVMTAILCQFSSTKAPESLWEVEGDADDLLDKVYRAKFSNKYFGILLTQGGF
jgi:hypothetical protein